MADPDGVPKSPDGVPKSPDGVPKPPDGVPKPPDGVPKPPDGDKPRPVKSCPQLILEMLLFVVLLVPSLVQAFLRNLFPGRGKSLDGKVVLVTGAAGGLGKELALAFARQGCHVACVDIDNDKVLETAREIVRDGEKARAYHTNVAKVEEISRLREVVTRDLGPVDILVNNAALVYCLDLDDTTDQTIRAMAEVNFLSCVWTARAFLPQMKERGSGHIVTISSLSALAPVAHASMYVACKWAVTGFMESLRQEVQDLGFDNIHFTTVHPNFMTNIRLRPDFKRMKMFFQHPRLVAVRTLQGVKRNIAVVTVPDYIYYFAILGKFLPTQMMDWGMRIFSDGVLPMPAEGLERLEPIITDTTS